VRIEDSTYNRVKKHANRSKRSLSQHISLIIEEEYSSRRKAAKINRLVQYRQEERFLSEHDRKFKLIHKKGTILYRYIQYLLNNTHKFFSKKALLELNSHQKRCAKELGDTKLYSFCQLLEDSIKSPLMYQFLTNISWNNHMSWEAVLERGSLQQRKIPFEHTRLHHAMFYLDENDCKKYVDTLRKKIKQTNKCEVEKNGRTT